jgi:hypothetical protein
MRHMQRNNREKILVSIICGVLLLATLAEVHETRGEGQSSMFIDPAVIQVSPGDNFTITVKASDVDSMGAWQVALKYNLTVMNITALWIPDENVFGDPNVNQQQRVEPSYGVDYLDGLGYVLFGNSVFFGEVSVSSGLLCMANCTALSPGSTTILIATKSNPAHLGPSAGQMFSFLGTWSDQYQTYVDIPMSERSGIMINGGVAARPIAMFTITPTSPEKVSRVLIGGHAPIEGEYWQAYKGYSVTFNASSSIGRLTLDNGTTVATTYGISEYFWDFDDGTNATTDNPIIEHTYWTVGTYYVKLRVKDKETPPAESETIQKTLLVGLVLDIFDWSPLVYLVLAIAVVAAAFYVFKGTRSYLRRRKELETRRLMLKRSSTSP